LKKVKERREGRMMEDTGEDVLRQKPNVVVTFFRRLGQTYQLWLDRSSTHTAARWISTVVLILCFGARIVLAQVNSLLRIL
jgi:hypothetical protein